MNNEFTEEKIEKLANLLMIGVTEEEKKMVASEFQKIDADINKLNDIEYLKDIEPMTHCLDDFEFELREDIVNNMITTEEALANCDDVYEDCVSVPKVVG